MEETIKETVVRDGEQTSQVESSVSTERKVSSFQTVQSIVYFFFGGLEILLVFRFILKLLGASTSSNFISLIYSLTEIFISPFEGIFSRGVSEGLETTSFFEPATVVAIVVYIFIAWGIVKLIQILAGKQEA
jgi:hypothetical protein